MLLVTIGGINPVGERVRSATLSSIIGTMRDSEEISVIHMMILADHPETGDSFLPQVPKDKILNGTLTLNVSSSAVPDLHIEDGLIKLSCRFNGQSTALDIPVGLIFTVAAFGESNEPEYVERLDPFINYPEEAEAPPPPKGSHLKVVK